MRISINTTKHFLCLVSLLLLAGTLQAQNNLILHGVVKDGHTNLPVEGATVIVKNANKSTGTDAQGAFEIRELPEGRYIIVASLIGYGTKMLLVDVTEESNYIEITLSSEAKELSSVTVVGQTEEQAEADKVRNNVMPVTTAWQIENRAGNLNEILARQAGVQIRLSGGLGSESRISVRGLEGKRVQIFLDGNPLNSPDGSLGINDLPVQIIERIEIYKGSVPAWLGGDGLGSAVNVVFRHCDVSYIDASLSRQSFNTQLASLILKKTFDKRSEHH